MYKDVHGDFFTIFWDGAGYFLAKVLLVRAEFTENGKNIRIIGLFVYLLGFTCMGYFIGKSAKLDCSRN
jgi:hypothetical protein